MKVKITKKEIKNKYNNIIKHLPFLCYNRQGRKSEVPKEINYEIYNHYF